MKILCVGKITYDYSLPIDGFPIEGLNYSLPEKVENSSGGACNCAYLLAKWKEEVFLSAAVGGDDLGTRIKRELDDFGINSTHIETVFESKTPISFVLINKNNGQKTSFAINGKEPHLKKYEYDFIPEIILMDGYEYSASITICNRYQNAITILDASEADKNTIELAKYAKYIIASKKFAEGISGEEIDFSNPTTLLNVYKKVATKYPNNNVVITLGEHGAMYLDNNQIKVMPGLKTAEVKDSSGAGDIFRAAFAAGISRGYEIEKIIRIANIASGLSLKTIGAKDSIPMFSDVASYYESKFGSIENPINVPTQNQVSQIPNLESSIEEQKDDLDLSINDVNQTQIQETPVQENIDVSS